MLRVDPAHRLERDPVAVRAGDTLGPCGKLGAGPFEAMVGVPQRALGQAGEVGGARSPRRPPLRRSPQPSFAAAQIQHARRAVLPEDTRHRLQSQVVQPDRELDGVFAGILPRDGAGIGVAVPLALREPRDRLARQPPLMTQVPLRDEPSLRMVGQPAFAAPQQLLQLILTDVTRSGCLCRRYPRSVAGRCVVEIVSSTSKSLEARDLDGNARRVQRPISRSCPGCRPSIASRILSTSGFR